jgi:hypothetical protein
MMDAQDSNTFLEEFVSSSELLPTEVRRNFELMRELDRDVIEANRQSEEAEVSEDATLSERSRAYTLCTRSNSSKE